MKHWVTRNESLQLKLTLWCQVGKEWLALNVDLTSLESSEKGFSIEEVPRSDSYSHVCRGLFHQLEWRDSAQLDGTIPCASSGPELYKAYI